MALHGSYTTDQRPGYVRIGSSARSREENLPGSVTWTDVPWVTVLSAWAVMNPEELLYADQ